MSDMKALALLRERVNVGTMVYVTNHAHLFDSGVSEIVELSHNMHGSGEPGYHSVRGGKRSYFLWPKEGDDFEVSGSELRIYNPNSAYTGGRSLTLTLRFSSQERRENDQQG